MDIKISIDNWTRTRLECAVLMFTACSAENDTECCVQSFPTVEVFKRFSCPFFNALIYAWLKEMFVVWKLICSLFENLFVKHCSICSCVPHVEAVSLFLSLSVILRVCRSTAMKPSFWRCVLLVEFVQCVARYFIALSFCRTTCHWSLLLQVSAVPRRLRSLWSGFTLHGTTRLFAAHGGAGRPDSLHVHHSCAGYCRLQAAQVQGQESVFHYCKLT